MKKFLLTASLFGTLALSLVPSASADPCGDCRYQPTLLVAAPPVAAVPPQNEVQTQDR